MKKFDEKKMKNIFNILKESDNSEEIIAALEMLPSINLTLILNWASYSLCKKYHKKSIEI